MKKAQSGFTLVEMVMVVIVVGTLSAVAVPKYVDYKEGAGVAAVKGIAASLGSAAANNYSAVVALMPTGVSMTKCTDLPTLLTGGLPDGVAVEAYTDNGAAGDGKVATIGAASSLQGVASVITPATIGVCRVKSSKFNAWMTFPYTPISVIS